MTHNNLAERNIKNAQKSTGPRTEAGKRKVSQNARRHGATAKPDPSSVATWLRVILDTPNLAPEVFLGEDERARRALALAEAEARVVIAYAALSELEEGRVGSQELNGKLDQIAGLIKSGAGEGMSKADYGIAKLLFKVMVRSNRDDTQPGGREHRLRRRYLREARARRRKAFRRWLDCLSQTPARTA